MSSSQSTSATSTTTKDGRVGVDNGAVGVSAEGDVSVHIVPDEAFYLGEAAIESVGAIAGEVVNTAADVARNADFRALETNELLADFARNTVSEVTGTFAKALTTTQQNAKTESGQIAEQVTKIGLPLAALAFVATQIWGK